MTKIVRPTPRSRAPLRRFHTDVTPWRSVCLFASCSLLLLASGCGGGMESSVRGTATLDGQPLQRGNVAFHPVKSGAIAYGSISADGAYELKTGGSDGLAPGEYRVTVISTEPPEKAPQNRAPTPGKLITPQHYGSVGTTPLTKEIKSGSNRIDLELISGAAP